MNIFLVKCLIGFDLLKDLVGAWKGILLRKSAAIGGKLCWEGIRREGMEAITRRCCYPSNSSTTSTPSSSQSSSIITSTITQSTTASSAGMSGTTTISTTSTPSKIINPLETLLSEQLPAESLAAWLGLGLFLFFRKSC